MKAAIPTLVSVTLAVSGCANYRPIVDTQGVDSVKYENDLAACQAYADQVSPGARAGAGALIGAALGAALAAAAGANRGRNSGVGAVTGAASGAGEGARAQVDVIRNCMTGRGYKVLQ